MLICPAHVSRTRRGPEVGCGGRPRSEVGGGRGCAPSPAAAVCFEAGGGSLGTGAGAGGLRRRVPASRRVAVAWALVLVWAVSACA
ncbi:unnamed protein product [Urochloa humidicola]